MDILLLGWGILQIVQFIPPDVPGHALLHDSFTNLLRRAFLFYVDVLVLYFVVSRSCLNRRAIVEVQAAFCLACAVMSLVAAFEFARNWLIYSALELQWSDNPILYLRRGNWLRAQASAGHPLALGYLIAIAFGFWLYLRSQIQSIRRQIAGFILFWLGLLAAYSRGPWIGATSSYLGFVALGPRALRGLLKSTFLGAIVGGVILASPLGDRIIEVLPFMGGKLTSVP